jgi:hypothetical protein
MNESDRYLANGRGGALWAASAQVHRAVARYIPTNIDTQARAPKARQQGK